MRFTCAAFRIQIPIQMLVSIGVLLFIPVMASTVEGYLQVGVTYNIENYGADPNGNSDSSPALQTVLNLAENQSNATVIIPPGRFRMNSRCVYEINSGSGKKINIVGSGELTTKILVYNTNGFLKISELSGSSGLQVSIRGLCIKPRTGNIFCALEIQKASIDNGSTVYAEVRDLNVFSDNVNTYFNDGIKIWRVRNLRMENVEVRPIYTDDPDSDPFICNSGVMMINCPDATLNFLYIWNAARGICYYINRSGFDPGKITMKNCWIVCVAQGIHFWNTLGASVSMDATISHGHINYRDYGVHLYKVHNVTVDHLLLYCRDRSGSYSIGGDRGSPRLGSWKGIWCHQADNVDIIGNVFAEACTPNNTSVYVDGYSDNTFIRGNIFASEGTAIYERSGTTVSEYNTFNKHRFGDWHYSTIYDVTESFSKNDF